MAIIIQDELLYLSPDGSLQASQMIHRLLGADSHFSATALSCPGFSDGKELRTVSTNLEFLEGWAAPATRQPPFCFCGHCWRFSPRFVQRPSFAGSENRRRHRSGCRGTWPCFGRRPDTRRSWQLKMLLEGWIRPGCISNCLFALCIGF